MFLPLHIWFSIRFSNLKVAMDNLWQSSFWHFKDDRQLSLPDNHLYLACSMVFWKIPLKNCVFSQLSRIHSAAPDLRGEGLYDALNHRCLRPWMKVQANDRLDRSLKERSTVNERPQRLCWALTCSWRPARFWAGCVLCTWSERWKRALSILAWPWSSNELTEL